MADFRFSDEEIKQFTRDGFILGPQVIEPEKIGDLVAEVMRVIDERDRADIPQPVWVKDMTGGKGDRPVWQIVNIWQGSKVFEELMRSPGVAAAAAQLMQANELRIWHDQIQYKPPQRGGKTGWHQDSMAWPPIAPKGRQITAWIALDDADEENGAMSMVPGSHHWGPADEVLHGIEDFHRLPEEHQGHRVTKVLCPVKAGCVHFHHGLTWHGSHDNTSGRHRRAIALHYMTEQTVYTGIPGHGATPHPMARFITAEKDEKIAGHPFELVYKSERIHA